MKILIVSSFYYYIIDYFRNHEQLLAKRQDTPWVIPPHLRQVTYLDMLSLLLAIHLFLCCCSLSKFVSYLHLHSLLSSLVFQLPSISFTMSQLA